MRGRLGAGDFCQQFTRMCFDGCSVSSFESFELMAATRRLPDDDSRDKVSITVCHYVSTDINMRWPLNRMNPRPFSSMRTMRSWP